MYLTYLASEGARDASSRVVQSAGVHGSRPGPGCEFYGLSSIFECSSVLKFLGTFIDFNNLLRNIYLHSSYPFTLHIRSIKDSKHLLNKI